MAGVTLIPFEMYEDGFNSFDSSSVTIRKATDIRETDVNSL